MTVSPRFDVSGSPRIRLDPETPAAVYDPETLESDRKGIYLAECWVAGMHTNEIFIENGRFHGKIIAEELAQFHSDESV